MKFVFKDFCGTLQAMQVDDVVHCRIANQPSASYFLLYLSNFLSFHTWNNEILSKISVKFYTPE